MVAGVLVTARVAAPRPTLRRSAAGSGSAALQNPGYNTLACANLARSAFPARVEHDLCNAIKHIGGLVLD